MLPQSAREYYLEQQKIMGVVLLTAKRIWGEHPPLDFDFWWSENVDQLTALAVAGQSRAIAGTEDYVSAVLAEMGTPVDPDIEVDPSPLVGVASDGRPLDSLMYGAIIRTKAKIGQAETVDSTVMFDAWQSGLSALLTRFQTQIADVARVATSLSIAARRDVGYVRMLNPPSCPKCAVLAGKFYRYNTGFLRHPGCDCRHIPSRENTARDVRTDPREYFDSLTAPEQDRWFTATGAQAIRDGADINQVVNARRGLSVAGGVVQTRNVYGRELLTTTEGVTKRGIAGRAIIARGRDAATTPRLMPEAIYEIAEDHADALRLLQLNGYVVDRVPAAGVRSVSPAGGPSSGSRSATGGGGQKPPKPPTTGNDRSVTGGDDGDDPFENVAYPHEYTVYQDHSLLTAAERQTILDYTAGTYLQINRALRGDGPMTPEIADQIDILRGAINKFPLPQTFRTSRETEASDLGLHTSQISDDLIGEFLREAGFMSTSGLKDPPKIVDRQDPLILDILVPEGTPAIMLGEDLTKASASERELLLIDARELFIFGVVFDTELQMWRIQASVISDKDGE